MGLCAAYRKCGEIIPAVTLSDVKTERMNECVDLGLGCRHTAVDPLGDYWWLRLRGALHIVPVRDGVSGTQRFPLHGVVMTEAGRWFPS